MGALCDKYVANQILRSPPNQCVRRRFVAQRTPWFVMRALTRGEIHSCNPHILQPHEPQSEGSLQIPTSDQAGSEMLRRRCGTVTVGQHGAFCNHLPSTSASASASASTSASTSTNTSTNILPQVDWGHVSSTQPQRHLASPRTGMVPRRLSWEREKPDSCSNKEEPFSASLTRVAP